MGEEDPKKTGVSLPAGVEPGYVRDPFALPSDKRAKGDAPLEHKHTAREMAAAALTALSLASGIFGTGTVSYTPPAGTSTVMTTQPQQEQAEPPSGQDAEAMPPAGKPPVFFDRQALLIDRPVEAVARTIPAVEPQHVEDAKSFLREATHTFSHTIHDPGHWGEKLGEEVILVPVITFAKDAVIHMIKKIRERESKKPNPILSVTADIAGKAVQMDTGPSATIASLAEVSGYPEPQVTATIQLCAGYYQASATSYYIGTPRHEGQSV